MSKVIVFNKQAGANIVKGVKRFRGEKPSSGPEVKKYNVFESSATYQGAMGSHDFINSLHGNTTLTSVNFFPMVVYWPTLGTQNFQRIGSKINFKALRLKGWITLAPTQVSAIRWRMVLCRLDSVAGATISFDQVGYLNQYTNSDVSLPSSTNWDYNAYASFCRHNFYKKFKNVDNKDFKSKVIASGVLPATTEYRKMSLTLVGTVAGGNANLATSTTYPSYLVGAYTSNAGYLPFDVTVKINDCVDCEKNLRRYFVVFECDTGYGWDANGGVTKEREGMLINCYGRAYFTDE